MGTPGYPIGASASLHCHNPWGQYQPYGDMQVPHGDTQAPCWGHCRPLGSRSMGTPWGHLDTPGGSMPILGVRPHGDTQAPHWGHCQPPQLHPPPPHGDTRALLGTPKHPLGTLPAPGVTQPWGHLGPPPHSQPVLPLRMSKSPSVSPPPGGARIPLWVPPPPLGTPPMCLQCPTAALPPLYKPLHCKYRTMYIAAAGGGTGTRRHRDTGKGLPSILFPPPAPPSPPLLFFFPFFSLFRAFFCT